jgi:DNA recombination protein RmuC
LDQIALLWPALEASPLALMGLGAGFGVALVMSFVTRRLRQEIKGLREARQEANTDLADLRAARQAQDIALAQLQTRAEQAARLETQIAAVQAQHGDTREALARANAALETERATHSARLQELRDTEASLKKEFQSLAAQALEANNARFLSSVTERFEKHQQAADQDLGARQKHIETLLKPIHESLGKFERQVGEIEKAREGAYAAIRQQVSALAQAQTHLTQETGRLVTALRAPKTRGNWGEFQLRQVVEMAGMVDHVDFQTETSIATEDGRMRPDAVINLPGGKRIVVDAKTSLDAYLTAANLEDGPEKNAQMQAHVTQLRTQMQGLAKKSYFEIVAGSPDFVVMFVPGEGFYSTALAIDPTLFDDAIRNRIIIATPTTLVALLKSVAYGWQQERMAENAQAAVDLAQELHKRFSTLGERLEKLGKSISNTVRDFNQTVATAESRVLPQARKFETMHIAQSGTEVPQLSPLEGEVRALTSAELRDPEASSSS